MCVKTNRSKIFFFLLRGGLLTYGKKYLAFFNFLTLLNPRDYYICTLCKFRIPLIFRDFLLGCCKITPVWFSTMRNGSFNGFCVAMVSIGNDQISVYSFENNNIIIKRKKNRQIKISIVWFFIFRIISTKLFQMKWRAIK